jgi:hypothetical protein
VDIQVKKLSCGNFRLFSRCVVCVPPCNYCSADSSGASSIAGRSFGSACSSSNTGVSAEGASLPCKDKSKGKQHVHVNRDSTKIASPAKPVCEAKTLSPRDKASVSFGFSVKQHPMQDKSA